MYTSEAASGTTLRYWSRVMYPLRAPRPTEPSCSELARPVDNTLNGSTGAKERATAGKITSPCKAIDCVG